MRMMLMVAFVFCAGCGEETVSDCSRSTTLTYGWWHQENVPVGYPTDRFWNRENLTFFPDCTCVSTEYEGGFSSMPCTYQEQGYGVPGNTVTIDFGGAVGWPTRRGFLAVDSATSGWSLHLTTDVDYSRSPPDPSWGLEFYQN
jgi:hypothetical protein